jgi:hypothetical protein
MLRKFGRIENIAPDQVIDATAELRNRKVMGKLESRMGEASGEESS